MKTPPFNHNTHSEERVYEKPFATEDARIEALENDLALIRQELSRLRHILHLKGVIDGTM